MENLQQPHTHSHTHTHMHTHTQYTHVQTHTHETLPPLLTDRLSLHPFSGQRAGGNGRATAKSLELCVDNLPTPVHSYLLNTHTDTQRES